LSAVLLQLLQEVTVLEFPQRPDTVTTRIASRRFERQLNATRLQERDNSVMARFAIHVASVVGNDIKWNQGFAGACGAFLKEVIKKLLPRMRMHASRLCQDAIHVEQNRVVVAR
jgi:hypothetical protein